MEKSRIEEGDIEKRINFWFIFAGALLQEQKEREAMVFQDHKVFNVRQNAHGHMLLYDSNRAMISCDSKL